MLPGYFAHEYQGFSCRLIFSESLPMSSADSFKKLLSPTLCEWKAGKAKRESAYSKKGFTLMPEKEEPMTEDKTLT